MKKFTLIIATILLVTVTIISQTGCSKKVEPVTKTSYYLDTVCTITIHSMKDMDKENAEKIISEAFSLCNDYENLLSKTREGTDIYKINHAEGKPVTCDTRTIDLIKKGIYYGDKSKGKFDITIGKVTDLWDFHAENPKVPADTDIQEALSCVDYKQIRINGNQVALTNPKGEIDLGGIAKGYIGDKLGEFLEEKGVTGAIISLGGNIVAVGDKDGEDFSVGIEKPYSETSEIIGSVYVKNSTVVTSGIYERYFEVNGKKYHHILNVKTGYPVENDIESVTLVAKMGKSVDCDALSTTCLILGIEEGTKLIEGVDGVEALFQDKDGKITKTSGMKYEAK